MSSTIIIKIGTSTIINHPGLIEDLVKDVQKLKTQRFIFIISGAIAYGKKISREKHISSSLAAGIGQAHITSQFYYIFKKQGIRMTQVLIHKDNIEKNTQRRNLKKILEEAIKLNIVLLINENDVIEKNSFQGNDKLTVEISKLVNPKKVIFLTDVNGLLDSNMTTISKVKNSADLENSKLAIINKKAEDIAGVGGIQCKVTSCLKLAKAQIESHIANGKETNIISKIINNKTYKGTHFTPYLKDTA